MRTHIQYSPLVALGKMLVLGAGITIVLACGFNLGYGNELVNGNLDNVAVGPQQNATPTAWTIQAYKAMSGPHTDGLSSETWCNVQAEGGYGAFFKPFQGAVGDEITVTMYQDVPAGPGTSYTLSGYAAGEVNFCAFFNTNEPAPKALFVVEFIDIDNNIIASNALDLVEAGLPSGGPGTMTLFTTPQYLAPSNTVTVRAGAILLNAYNTTGAQSFFVDALDLEIEAPTGAPTITQQPANTTVSPGSTATFTVTATNATGATYQWQLNGTNLTNGGNISGATSSTLTITNASAADIGRYRVRVSNGTGTAVSSEATLALTSISLYPVISIFGQVGDTYRLDYSTNAQPAVWIPLVTNKLTISPTLIIDTNSPMSNSRFYRAILVQ